VYAVIEDRGTQIKVAPGDVVDIDLMPGSDPQSGALTFDRVLLMSGGDGGAPTIGTPYIDGASVTADVLSEVQGEKLRVIMYKRRKGQRKTRGHRQGYLRIKIASINA